MVAESSVPRKQVVPLASSLPMIYHRWNGSIPQWEADMANCGVDPDQLESLYLKNGNYSRAMELPMVKHLTLGRCDSERISLPKYPRLEKLDFQQGIFPTPVYTNGVRIHSYDDYVAAWSLAKKATVPPHHHSVTSPPATRQAT